jgi:ferritin-like metal-binding protein YciE
METIDSLESLLLHEIKDLYYAEKQIVKALPKVIKKASSPTLKNALEDHLAQTEGHVARLEQVFEILGQSPKAVKCEGMEGILDEAETMMKQDDSPDTLDAAIIASAQKVEHYEIASYGSVVEWASILGRQDIKTLLSQTLQDEKKADQKLTQLAASGINQQSARKQKLAA